MKKYLLYTIAAVTLMGMTTSCSDFGDVNVDPEHPNEGNMDYSLLFGNAQVQALGSDWDVWRNALIYSGCMIQHVTSAEWSQGVFYTYNDGYSAAYWDALYSGDRAGVRDIQDVIRHWENDENYGGNDYQFARIVRAYIFHRMTDLYGDIPYSQAGQPWAYSYPEYDAQQDVYDGLLNELNDAQLAIDESATSKLGSADLYFGGDATMWKKFANSIMLRVAMRMSEVDREKAQTWVNTAVKNGIIMSNDENAYLLRSDGLVTKDSSEPYAKIFVESDAGKFFLSETFVNMLKSTNDPRLPLIGTRVADPTKTYSSEGYDLGSSTDYASWNGLPIGYELAEGPYALSDAPGVPTNPDGTLAADWKSHYPVPNRLTYSNPVSPTFIVTYAENMFLLADAVQRGMTFEGAQSAQYYYEEGVRAAMKQFSIYSSASDLYNTYLNDAAIDAYLAANPYDASKGLKQINEQYYIATFCDEYESFANWRRTGYPELKSVYADGKDPYPNRATGEIPVRFLYPVTEQTANADNYNAAAERQNFSKSNADMGVPVWWDVEPLNK